MEKFILILGFLFMAMACQANNKEFSILHYNIKELDSSKLSSENQQILALKHILAPLEFDIFSVNEIQYDLPGIPNAKFTSEGQNLLKLKSLLNLGDLTDQVFYPANTGKNARPNASGSYFSSPDSETARNHADQVNFGIFPAQYSTGALFRFKKESEKVISDLSWKVFNPTLDLSKFKDALGNKYPEDMSLFDKNFTDTLLDIHGEKVHLILLHTVPAFNFGNEYGLNPERNLDQLRFLEWYLTGSSDIEINIPGITPLEKDAHFVAVGDWNVALDNEQALGSKVLQRLFKKLNTWLPKEKLSFTNESSYLGPKPLRLMLDYIMTSKNLEITEGKILHPKFIREELGCEASDIHFHPSDEMVSVEYKEKELNCHALLGIDYFNYKVASDHFPIYAKIKFK